MARGIFGQDIYVNPMEHVVIARGERSVELMGAPPIVDVDFFAAWQHFAQAAPPGKLPSRLRLQSAEIGLLAATADLTRMRPNHAASALSALLGTISVS